MYDWLDGEIVWRFLTTAAVCKVAPLGDGLLAGIKFTHKSSNLKLPLSPSKMDRPDRNVFVVNTGLPAAPGNLWSGAEVVVASCNRIRHQSTSDGVYNWGLVALPRHPDTRSGPTSLVMTGTRASLGVYRLSVWHWPSDTVWEHQHNGYVRGMTLQHRTPSECLDAVVRDTMHQRVHVLSSDSRVTLVEASLCGWTGDGAPTNVEFADLSKTQAPGNQWAQLVPVGLSCSIALVGWVPDRRPGVKSTRSLIVPKPGLRELHTLHINFPQTDRDSAAPVAEDDDQPEDLEPRRRAGVDARVIGHGGCFGAGGLLVLGDRICRITTTLPEGAEAADVPAPEDQRGGHSAVAEAVWSLDIGSAPDGSWWRWPGDEWQRRRRAALWRWTLNKQRRAARARRRGGQ